MSDFDLLALAFVHSCSVLSDQDVAVLAAVADGVLLAVGEQELAVDPVPGAGDQGHVPRAVDGAALQLNSELMN